MTFRFRSVTPERLLIPAMAQQKNLCVLVVEIVGRQRIAEEVGPAEAMQAIERCTNRVDRAIEAGEGKDTRRSEDRICATFASCDSGVQAACEMLERVLSLPPLRGLRMVIRAGVHYGSVDPTGGSEEEGERFASRLAARARHGQTLASSAAVMLLTPTHRYLAASAALKTPETEGLEWPAFVISRQGNSVTSVPPATRLSQRLRIRHQEDTLFVDENRPVLLFGRELGNDIVIIDPRASRQHSRIERRREGFVLIDQSTNGTYLGEEGGKEVCIKSGEASLTGPGRIGCGFSANEIERDLVFFEIV
jgi:class 3 adenylate cyclase